MSADAEPASVHPARQTGRRDGSTLMEAVCSILCLTIAVVGFFGLHSSMLQRNAFSGRATAATALAQQVIERHLATGSLQPGEASSETNGIYTVHSRLRSDSQARGVLIEVNVSWRCSNGRASRIAVTALGPST